MRPVPIALPATGPAHVANPEPRPEAQVRVPCGARACGSQASVGGWVLRGVKSWGNQTASAPIPDSRMLPRPECALGFEFVEVRIQLHTSYRGVAIRCVHLLIEAVYLPVIRIRMSV